MWHYFSKTDVAGNMHVTKERQDSDESDSDLEDAMTKKGSDIEERQIEILIKNTQLTCKEARRILVSLKFKA